LRKFTEFKISEWVKLTPLIHAFKQTRNDFFLRNYLKNKSDGLTEKLHSFDSYRGKNIAVIIAFEQPWALEFLFQMAKKNLSDLQLIVCDNSRDIEKKQAIKEICHKYDIPYLELPPYKTKHINRSHGVAMTWAYHRIIKSIKPSIFGFIDHDLIPITSIKISEKLSKQSLYGQKNKGFYDYWSLWAGYCFYKFDLVKDEQLNFLYDFSRGLDTGGRNWASLYSKHHENNLTFAPNVKFKTKSSNEIQSQEIELIDESWWHLSGISYNNNFDKRVNLFKNFARKLLAGESFIKLIE